MNIGAVSNILAMVVANKLWHIIEIFRQDGILKFHANNDPSAKICPWASKLLNFVCKICSLKKKLRQYTAFLLFFEFGEKKLQDLFLEMAKMIKHLFLQIHTVLSFLVFIFTNLSKICEIRENLTSEIFCY